MRTIARIILLLSVSLFTYSAAVLAQSVDLDLLNYVVNPQTGVITVLSIMVVVLWKSWRTSEKEKEELHRIRLDDIKNVNEIIQDQRDYYNTLRDKYHEDRIALSEILTKSIYTLERFEKILDKQ